MAGNSKATVVKKQLSYKRAVYLQNDGDLQSDLDKSIAIAKTVGQRTQTIDPTDGTLLLLNSIRTNWSMTFGSMLLYTPGKNQPLVTENNSATELTVEQLAPPPTQQGSRRNFIESVLYFGVKNNHVVVLQSAALKARQLETHLIWLLQTQTKVLAANDQVELADQPSKSAIARALQSPIKSVNIGVPLETEDPPVTSNTRSSKKTQTFSPIGKGFDVLNTLLGGSWLSKMKLKDSLDESRLKVEVQVTYTRETSTAGQNLLNDIAVNLRHQDPEDVHIELKNGGRLTGDDLKISGPISVESFGGLVDPADLYKQMREWLEYQIKAGLIDP